MQACISHNSIAEAGLHVRRERQVFSGSCGVGCFFEDKHEALHLEHFEAFQCLSFLAERKQMP